MTASTPRIDRVARGVLAVSCAWFAFAAAWGMFGIPGGGHTGAGSAGNAMAAEQIVRWKTVYPLWGWYEALRPELHGAAMCHHPFAQYWIPAFFIWIFGHPDFVVHLPAVLMSAAMPPLLYGIAKERWGAPVGAVAAAGYVVVPIAVGFSNFWNLETVCIFGSLLFFWGHTRHAASGKTRYLVASLVGLVVACSGDWVGYLIVAPTLVWSFLRAFVAPPGASPHIAFAGYARWWACSIMLVGGTLLLWVGLFQHAGHLGEWLSAGDMRGGAEGTPLGAALESRKAWIEFCFTPLAIWLGKLALPVCLLRLVILRQDEEAYAPSLLFGAVLQYVVFKEGADVHIFWPHYFAPYFALALAQLAATVGAGAGWVARRWSPPRARLVAGIVGLTVGLVPALAMAHDGVQSLWVWRRTGGRYDDSGTLIRSHIDLLYVLKNVVRPGTPAGGMVDASPSAQWGWEHQWTFHGNSNTTPSPTVANPASAMHPFWIARSSGMSAPDVARIAAGTHVRAYGDTWVVDQREPAGPLDAYSLNEREPGVLDWLFDGGTEPARSIGHAPDPWLTWEWRIHLGQAAAPPSGEPRSLDEMRIAHNVAVARGDAADATRWRDRIERELDRTVRTSFTGDLQLLGVRVTRGVQPRVESWFQANGPVGDATFDVRSEIIARGAFSLIPIDATARDMAWPPSLPTRLWRPGFIYKTEAVLNHRIGEERYTGAWRSLGGPSAPRRTDGKPDTTLVVVP